MLQRENIISRLQSYVPFDNKEQQHLKKTLDFVIQESKCFDRATVSGHVTGSAWIISHDQQFVLLTHHMRLNKWFQLGGHSDGCPNTRLDSSNSLTVSITSVGSRISLSVGSIISVP